MLTFEKFADGAMLYARELGKIHSRFAVPQPGFADRFFPLADYYQYLPKPPPHVPLMDKVSGILADLEADAAAAHEAGFVARTQRGLTPQDERPSSPSVLARAPAAFSPVDRLSPLPTPTHGGPVISPTPAGDPFAGNLPEDARGSLTNRRS